MLSWKYSVPRSQLRPELSSVAGNLGSARREDPKAAAGCSAKEHQQAADRR